jgi:hypothetical protein
MVATLAAISSSLYAFANFCVANSRIRCFRSLLSRGEGPEEPIPSRRWWSFCESDEATPEAARTASVVASSTWRRIFRRSKKTAGSMGRGLGAE